ELEELERERAADDRRILDEIGHLAQQTGFAAGAAHAALEAQGLGVELARDLVVTVAPRQDDEILEQPRTIFVERPDLDRPARAPARREKAMAVGDGAGRDVLHLTGQR